MPNFNFISGAEVIARIDNKFTIDFSDWIMNAPLWILNGLLEIDSPISLIEAHTQIEITDFFAELPIGVKGINYISFNGVRLPHVSSMARKTDETPTDYVGPYYTHRGGNSIETSFKEGFIELYYKQISTTLSPELGIQIPDVPDNIFLIQALANYIMMQLLIKGYKHPTLNLRDNSPYLNPGMAFDKYTLQARNSLGAMTYDERVEVSNLIHEFVSNYNYANTENLGTLSGTLYKPLV